MISTHPKRGYPFTLGGLTCKGSSYDFEVVAAAVGKDFHNASSNAYKALPTTHQYYSSQVNLILCYPVQDL